MYEIFTIRPKLEKNVYFSTSKEYQVIFEWGRVPINGHYQQPTFCVIRDGINVMGLGFTIQNPHDNYEMLIGEQVAFSRAVDDIYNRFSITYGVNFGNEYLKGEKRAWRVSLRKARLAKEKEEAVS